MGLALFKERRLTQRRRLTGLLPGRLINVGTGQDLAVKPVDVSRNGLGIIVSQELELETEVRLQIQDRHVSMKVAWGQPDFSKSDRFRYGLIAISPEDDIEEEFIQSGCLV
jgi:hypothetical protein